MDYRSLANSLVNNGQFHLPPNDVIRQAHIIGYDPGWNGTNHDHPTVSVELAGDITPVHGLRFAETYNPNIGDTVWVVMSGEDAWVLGRLTDISSGNNDTGVRAPTTPGVVGHGNFTDTTAITSTSATNLTGTAVTTSILPNRIYKIDASFSFTITGADPTDVFGGTFTNGASTITLNGLTASSGVGIGASVTADGIRAGTTVTNVGAYSSGTSSQVITISQATYKTKNTDTPITFTSSHGLSTGIMTPSGYYEMNTRNVINGVYTASGHTTWANTSTSGNYPYNWTGTYPNAQFVWHLAAKVSATGDTTPTATGIFQRITIHDLGVAS